MKIVSIFSCSEMFRVPGFIDAHCYEVKLHVKSASFSTENGQTSRFSFITLFLTIKTLSENISITLFQIPF